MSEATIPSVTELREELQRVRLQQKITTARTASRALRESWSGSYTGLNWGDLVDPRDSFRDADMARGFPIGNRQDRQDGRNRPFVWADLDLDLIRGQARWVETRNKLAQGAINTLTNFTIKTGYAWEAQPRKRFAKDDTAQTLAGQVNDFMEEWEELQGCASDDTQAANGASGLERSACRRAIVDGDVFVRFFGQQDGQTILRFVEPEQVRQPLSSPPNWLFGIETDPADIWRAIRYAVAYEAPEDWEGVPAAEMAHLKRNVPENVKRGISDFFSSADAFGGVENLLRNMREAGGVQAAIAWIEQFDGATASSVAANVAAARDQNRMYYPQPITGKEINYQRYEPGSVPKVGKGRTYVPPPIPVGASTHIQIVQANLRALGVRWCMPEFLISGDASNANYASTLVAGSPFVTAVECEQETFRAYFARWRWVAIRNAACAGRFVLNGHVFTFVEIRQLLKLHGTPPVAAIANKLQDGQVDDLDIKNGVISRQHRRDKLGVDGDKMRQQIAEEPAPPPAPEKVTAKVGDGTGQPPAPDEKGPLPAAAPAASAPSDLRTKPAGLTAVMQLQTSFYAGELPRAAAMANAELLLGFTAAEAAQLFPQEAPVTLAKPPAPEAPPGPPGPPKPPTPPAPPAVPVKESRFFPRRST